MGLFLEKLPAASAEDDDDASLLNSEEKLSALRVQDYFSQLAARGNVPKALSILKRAGASNPPMKGDELSSKPPQTPAGDRYGLRHWDGLTRFLDDGWVELDTNIVASAPSCAISRNCATAFRLLQEEGRGFRTWLPVAYELLRLGNLRLGHPP
jgi:hypothetical protein